MHPSAIHPLVTYLRQAMSDAGDPAQAPAMQAYMKTDQPFYGVQAAPRREIFRAALKQHPIRSREEYGNTVRDLWGGVYREEMYLALDLAQQAKVYRDLASWPLYVEMMRTATNWDTLDVIAAHLLGDLLRQHREKEAEVRTWVDDDNLWVRRTALLIHLKHKGETNLPMLSHAILHLAHEKEFFIRKAIGWVLRATSRQRPDVVHDWLLPRAHRASGVTVREAVRYLSPADRDAILAAYRR